MERVRRIPPHPLAILAITLASALAATACRSGDRVAETESKATSQPVRGTILSVALSDAGRDSAFEAQDIATGASRSIELPRGFELTEDVLALAPDLRRAAVLVSGEGGARLLVADLETGRVSSRVVPPAVSPQFSGPIWSADSRSLAFAVTSASPGLDCGADRITDLRLYVTGDDLSTLSERPALPATAITPGVSSRVVVSGWSPAGGTLLYQHERWDTPDCHQAPSRDLYLVDLSAPAPRQLAADHSFNTPAAWSPDGTRVVYGGRAEDETAVIISTASAQQTRVLQAITYDLWWTDAGLFAVAEFLESPFGPFLSKFNEQGRLERRLAAVGDWWPVSIADDGRIALANENRLRILSPSADVLFETRLSPEEMIVKVGLR
jgi:Tol biopolymer transport system component